MVLCGISTTFAVLSPNRGKVAHALLTRPPLKHIPSRPKPFRNMSPLDLHVLGTPPAFVLSQDQTLTFNPFLISTPQPLPSALASVPGQAVSQVSLIRNHLSFLSCVFLFLYRFQGSLALSRSRSKELVYHTKYPSICQQFFQNFLKNFCLFVIPEQSIRIILICSFVPRY